MTESDSGEKRYFAVPCSRNTGTNTMQMQSVDRNVGTATSAAPVTIASMQRFVHRDMAFYVFDHDRAVVDQYPDCQRETAEGQGIQGLTGQIDEQHRGDDG